MAHADSHSSLRRLTLAVALVIGTVLAVVGISRPASASTPDIVMWGHPGCPHCRAAHTYLDGLRARRPELGIVEHDVAADPASFEELRARSEQAGVDMVGVPSFLVRGTFLVGFDSPETTGRSIEAMLAPQPPASPPEHGSAHAPGSEPRVPSTNRSPVASEGELELPWFGGVSVRELGLPLFTIAVGLVDGFNPCAMWVLMFLLALLVNVKNRARMLAVSGTFVVVSGLAYFAFMAAWLNVFQLIGLSRAVQLVLGGVALVIGAVNIKDFFALGKSISFSIPEKAKPGIYARVRAIVRAENLWAALVGATVLAVLVNVIELVCTAGLPALYTQVLAQQGVSAGARYAYLALYNVAYMLDDSVMVGIAVVTLGRRKLQDRAGRWLKLVSGVAIVALGLLLLLAPGALVW
ncbi:MAG TPA: glutaredoxin family protein [Polyangiaceae bacterium]|nr:glutaredoxin family protein [Polyangiaceae bacterium]